MQFVKAPRAVKIAILGAVSVSGAGPARASTGCDAVSGEVYSDTQTGSFTVQLNGGANFSFNPGDTIKMTITAPAFARVQVTTPGGTVEVDNSTGPTPLTQPRQIVVPDTGGASVGAITISGAVSIGSGTVTVNFNCTNAGLNQAGGQVFGGQIDNAVQSDVPGGTTGLVFPDFQIPKFDPGAGYGEGYVGGSPTANLPPPPRRRSTYQGGSPVATPPDPRLAPLVAAVEAAQKALVKAEEELKQAFGESAEAIKFHVPTKAKLEQAQAELERARAKAKAAEAQLDQKQAAFLSDPSDATRASFDAATRAQKQALAELGAAESAERSAGIDEDIAGLVRAAARGRVSDKKAAVNAARADLAKAKAALAKATRALVRSDAGLVTSDAGGAFGSGPVFAGFSGNIVPVSAEPSSADIRQLAAGFNLRDARAAADAQGAALTGLLGDVRFNSWMNGGVTFHLDDGAGFDQDGETVFVSGGASYLVEPGVNVGLAARYGHTDRSGSTGATRTDTWSLAAFTQVQLPDAFELSAILSYSWVDIDADTVQGAVTASGKTDAESVAAQLTISRPFISGDWTFTPNAGVSAVDIDRDRFTASDGTVVDGSQSTQVSLLAGIDASTRIAVERPDGSTIFLTPSFGLNGFANVGRFDPLVSSKGNETRRDAAGLSATAGLAVDLERGAKVGLNAGFANFLGDQKSITLSGRFEMPF